MLLITLRLVNFLINTLIKLKSKIAPMATKDDAMAALIDCSDQLADYYGINSLIVTWGEMIPDPMPSEDCIGMTMFRCAHNVESVQSAIGALEVLTETIDELKAEYAIKEEE